MSSALKELYEDAFQNKYSNEAKAELIKRIEALSEAELLLMGIDKDE